MLILLSAVIVASVLAWGSLQIVYELKGAREEAARGRAVQLLALFASGTAAAQANPRALLEWQSLARTARQLFPAEFTALDRAAGATFPFSQERIQAAHAHWTAEWLAWERTHDADYKLRAATLEHELAEFDRSPVVRAQLDAVEREKLDLYQRRYEEYIRVARALQALLDH